MCILIDLKLVDQDQMAILLILDINLTNKGTDEVESQSI